MYFIFFNIWVRTWESVTGTFRSLIFKIKNSPLANGVGLYTYQLILGLTSLIGFFLVKFLSGLSVELRIDRIHSFSLFW